MSFNQPEPEPIRRAGETEVWPSVWADVERLPPFNVKDLLLADMRERDAIGWRNHGGPLLTNDGRRPLVDLYQEILDALAYAKNEMLNGTRHHAALESMYRSWLSDAIFIRWVLLQETGE